jgi:Flp pilus assembly protein TadG
MLDSCLLFRLDSTAQAKWRECGLNSVFARESLGRFARDERGSVTVEAVLWLPVFFAFLGLAVDGSVLFSNRALILRTIQDANRLHSIGRFGSNVAAANAAAEQYVRNNVQVCPAGVCPSDVSVDTNVDATGVITTRVQVPAARIDAIGLFGLLTGFTVGIQADYMQES